MLHEPPILNLSCTLYRLLLKLYPSHFRGDYGEEMQLVFRNCCRNAYKLDGACGVIPLWLSTIGDVVRSVSIEHAAALSTTLGGKPVLTKRIIDIVVASIALVLGAPLMVLIALLIRLDSAGPVFYVSPRIGRRGRPFGMLKFRTMTTLNHERAITRVGRILRPMALDEWPQFVNVLRGDMSLVGPRPEIPDRIDMDDPESQQILSIRPGMTGLAQLAYSGSYHPAADVRRELDLHYVNQRSTIGDTRILAHTLVMLVPPKHPK